MLEETANERHVKWSRQVGGEKGKRKQKQRELSGMRYKKKRIAISCG